MGIILFLVIFPYKENPRPRLLFCVGILFLLLFLLSSLSQVIIIKQIYSTIFSALVQRPTKHPRPPELAEAVPTAADNNVLKSSLVVEDGISNVIVGSLDNSILVR